MSNNVHVWEENVTIPTYKVYPPEKGPLFIENRAYQGSSGKVYPLPVTEKISDKKEDVSYHAIYLENDYLKVMVLPELGGRIQRAYDKTNGYDFVYYNHVIKPALVGLTGPWISGGIEFNWPQHHRPSTYSPDCVLVGSDERILNYRHPVPTSKKIEKSLMVVLGGEKYGLNVSMTRMVYFVPVPEEIKGRMQKTQKIFAAMQNLMKDGMSYQAYFRKAQELYAKEGCSKEWKMHHQGGPTGYGCREFTVTPETKGVIKKNQAYAWNPTIAGTKCEDTTFLADNGVEIFTRTKAWPCTVIETEYGSCSVADILYIKNE